MNLLRKIRLYLFNITTAEIIIDYVIIPFAVLVLLVSLISNVVGTILVFVLVAMCVYVGLIKFIDYLENTSPHD